MKKRITLFFAPVIIYYLLSRKARPWDLGSSKPFHSRKALLEFTAFLFAFGFILYFSILNAIFFALFGFLGFLMHLIVDDQLK